MLRSPVPYFGGKHFLRKQILEKFPDRQSYQCYIEPFFGGGSVFFGKQPSKYEVVNDIYDDLVNLFQVLKTCPREFLCELQHTLYSRSLFIKYKNELENGHDLSNLQRALRMYYMLKVSYGGMRQHFRPQAKCKPSLIPQEVDDFIQKVSERLRPVIIENKDYKDIIRIYDRKWSFFFLDPPYHVAGAKKGYIKHFTEGDFIEFEGILRNICGKFMLTINDDDFIRELFKSYRIEETKMRYNVTKGDRNNFNELWILNY
jgi:DNA adenine methylase